MRRFISFLLTARRQKVQLLSLVIMNSYVLQALKFIPCPGMNCYACPGAIFACPIGTLQHFAIIQQVPFYTLGVLGLIGALVGRLACGWLCPFGWLQERLYALGRRLRLAQWEVSPRLSWLRYAFLVGLVFLVPLLTLEPWFSKLCPVGTLQAGIPLVLWDAELRGMAGGLFVLKVAILAAFLAWMLLAKRPFCRLVCPLGAIWSPFNRVSALRLAVDEGACTRCDACEQACPVAIRPYEDPASTACIRCGECVKVCPTQALRLLGE